MADSEWRLSHRSLFHWSLFIAILLLAAGLRLTRLGLAEFKLDEATTSRSALAIAHEGRFPAIGVVSSRGPHNPPLMNYVLALPYAFSRDPRLAAGWVALLGVVAVGLAYWVGRTYFGWQVGALAALLFAASPWAVFHSRKIWAENLPALTLLFVAAVLALVVRRKYWALAGALVAAGCLVSLHLGGLAFFFILAVIVVLFRRHVRPVPLLVGLMLLALVLSPYLLHDARHGWPNLRAFAGLTGQETVMDLQAPRMAAWITGGYHLEDLAGARHTDFVGSILDLRWLDRVEMALLWIGLAYLVWRVGRDALTNRGHLSREGAVRLVLLCWFGVPVALLLRHTAPVPLHTFTLLYPVQHLIIALLLVDVMKWGKRNASRPTPPTSRLTSHVSRFTPHACLLLVALLLVWQVYLQEALFTFVDTHDTPGGYGAPVKYALAAAHQAEQLLAETGETELIALLPGAEPRYDGQAAGFDVLLPDHRPVDGRRALVLPSHPAVYLADPRAEPAVTMLAEVATEIEPALPLRAGSEASYRFFRWQPTLGKGAVTAPLPATGYHWASGATLLGYDWTGDPWPGGTVHWTLYWQVEGQPPAGRGAVIAPLHWFNHLVDGEGARWGQADGVGYPASEWQVGDTVLTWFDIAISTDAPPPPYFIRSGMYTYPDVVNVQLIDVAGNPAGEFVELGPIEAMNNETMKQ
jgi:NADH:ubiquinone oxidoreductase subunit K